MAVGEIWTAASEHGYCEVARGAPDAREVLGELEGYFADDTSRRLAEHLIAAGVERLALIKHLFIDAAVRGEGHGGELLDAVLTSLADTPVMLAANLGAQQAPGFDLVDFYAARGFHLLAYTDSGRLAVMIHWPEDEALVAELEQLAETGLEAVA